MPQGDFPEQLQAVQAEQQRIMREYARQTVVSSAAITFPQAPPGLFRPTHFEAPNDPFRQPIAQWSTGVSGMGWSGGYGAGVSTGAAPKRSCDNADKQLTEAIKKWEAQPKDRRGEMGP